MVILKNYDKIMSANGFVRIKSNEHSHCPICGSRLYVRDSKHRQAINQAGNREFYRLRRLKCRNKNCSKMHTELPDCLVPYKHYAADVIEAELIHDCEDCPADDATTWRWKNIFATIFLLAGKYELLTTQSYWIASTFQLIEKLKYFTHPLCIPFPNIRCYNSV